MVGAHALAFHGAPRFTGDLDIFVRPTEVNGERVLAAIADFGFPTAPLTPLDIVAGTKEIEMGRGWAACSDCAFNCECQLLTLSIFDEDVSVVGRLVVAPIADSPERLGRQDRLVTAVERPPAITSTPRTRARPLTR